GAAVAVAGAGAAHAGRELARRPRRARAAGARRGDLPVPCRACAAGRDVAGAVRRRRRVLAHVEADRGDRCADPRAPRRRRRDRGSRERRAARVADPERARRDVPRTWPSDDVAGAGVVRREVEGVPVLTLDRWIRDRARTTPGRVAIEYAGREVTYAELDASSEDMSQGLVPGTVVSTLTGNSPEHVALLFACAKAGAMLHPISWRLAPA